MRNPLLFLMALWCLLACGDYTLVVGPFDGGSSGAGCTGASADPKCGKGCSSDTDCGAALYCSPARKCAAE